MVYGYPPPAGAVTGEAVSVELRPARLGSRTVALALDCDRAVRPFLRPGHRGRAGRADGIDTDLASTLGLVIVLVIIFGYPVAIETLWRGRTLGKAAMGIRVVRDDGGPASFTAIFFRELLGYLFEKPGITLGILGVVTMTSSERAKRLGDMVAGTVVISTRIPGTDPGPVAMPPPLAGWAASADLSRIPDSLGLGIRQFLGRASELDAAARERVGGQLVAQLSRFVSPPPPPGTPGWAFLAAVLAERRRRDELAGIGPRSHVRGPAATRHRQPPPPPPPPPGPGGVLRAGLVSGRQDRHRVDDVDDRRARCRQRPGPTAPELLHRRQTRRSGTRHWLRPAKVGWPSARRRRPTRTAIRMGPPSPTTSASTPESWKPA